MKRFLTLFVTLTLVFSFTVGIADDYYYLSSHKYLDVLNSMDDFSLKNLENLSIVRSTLVLFVLLDLYDNNIINSLPDSLNEDSICVSTNSSIYSVFIPLEDQILITMSVMGTDTHAYLLYDISISNKNQMEIFMNGFSETASINDYWFVPAEDVYSMYNSITN